jgi:hypothetical protein
MGIAMMLPLQALAAPVCFTDNFGATYSIELGTSSGSRIDLYGYRKVSGCQAAVGGVAPLYGSATVINPTQAVAGWYVNNALDSGCVDFTMTLTFNLSNLSASGKFVNEGSASPTAISLTQTGACPTPAEPAPASTLVTSGPIPGIAE